MTNSIVKIADKINQLSKSGKSFAVVTMIGVRGSAPQELGAKMLVDEGGLVEGTIGGGKVEAKAIGHAQNLLNDKKGPRTETLTWNLQKDVHMTCGGEVQFLFEVFFYDHWHIAIYGAGHVAQSLIRMLLELDCQITCVDPRQEWLDKLPESYKLTKIAAAEPRATVAQMASQTYYCLMTQGHATDVPVLTEVLKLKNVPYVGVIGSDKKALTIKRDLRVLGTPEEKVNQFFCPIGLPIGKNTPGEIAISVVAQLLEIRG